MRENALKRSLKAGDVALGTLAWAGMDFIMICMEHSAYNLETVADLCGHAHAAGMTPVVRIPDLEYEHVTRLLDSGCQSLIVPHVETGAEVQRFIDMAKYHPDGHRGTAIYLGANTDYEDVEATAAMQHANANTLLGIIVENMEDILVPEIDLALVGFQDLAQSLGTPGKFDNPELRNATERVRVVQTARYCDRCRTEPSRSSGSHAGDRRAISLVRHRPGLVAPSRPAGRGRAGTLSRQDSVGATHASPLLAIPRLGLGSELSG